MNLKEDKNWRLIKNLEKGKYCFLVSVKNWAIELTQDEFDSLSKLLIKIEKQMNFVKGELLEEECINLEIEKSPWYVELEGNKKEWNLKIIFESIDNTRSFEMYWPIPIAENLSFEIIKMWESMY